MLDMSDKMSLLSCRRVSSPQARRAGAAGGFIMITCLMFLVLLTLLSLSMFRSYGLQERIAGNTRDKQRAFAAAQSALQFGEWWLGQGFSVGTGAVCDRVRDGNVITEMMTCSNPLADVSSVPWAARTEYLPSGMTVADGGGNTSAGDINYQAVPGLYINYLGVTPDALARLYQVSAFGYGGNSDTTSVVQSTYQIKTGVIDLGRL